MTKCHTFPFIYCLQGLLLLDFLYDYLISAIEIGDSGNPSLLTYSFTEYLKYIAVLVKFVT